MLGTACWQVQTAAAAACITAARLSTHSTHTLDATQLLEPSPELRVRRTNRFSNQLVWEIKLAGLGVLLAARFPVDPSDPPRHDLHAPTHAHLLTLGYILRTH